MILGGWKWSMLGKSFVVIWSNDCWGSVLFWTLLPSHVSMVMLVGSMLLLRTVGVVWWVLKRAVVPCGFGYALAACVPVGIRSVPLQKSLSPCQTQPCSLVLHCIHLCVQWVQPGLLVFLWKLGMSCRYLSHFLEAGWFKSSHQFACDGSPGDPRFLQSPSHPPPGIACVVLSDFPISASPFSLFEGSYWVVVIILLQLPQARTLKPAASPSDAKKGLCAQGTSFLGIACGLRSGILPPCKSCFACYLGRNLVAPLALRISRLWLNKLLDLLGVRSKDFHSQQVGCCAPWSASWEESYLSQGSALFPFLFVRLPQFWA